MNSCTRPRTGHSQMQLLSASQLKQFYCPRRWGFVRLLGQREPQGEAAMRGSAYHAEMEAWGKFGKVPTSRPALSALKYAPPPGLAEIEAPVRFDTPDSSWVGYIDVAYDLHIGEKRPVGTTGHTVIQDWKFTGSLRNAMAEEELLEDAAANIYAYEAYLGGAQVVSGRWVYVEMSGSCSTKVLDFTFKKARVLEIIKQLNSEAHELQKLYKQHREGLLNVLDLPTDTSRCFAYRQRCPHMEQCKPVLKIDISGADMNDFKAAMTAGFPGIPPLPKAAPPPLPPIPEAGFVNPPEAPKVAARSPEHAAELQGVTQAVATLDAPVQADDLDALNRDQLKALAVQMGVVSKASKARESSLRESIRAFRARAAGTAPMMDDPALAEIKQAVETQATKLVDISMPNEPTAFTAEPYGGQETDVFTLYINCTPRADTNHTILPFPALLDRAHEELRKEHPALQDYRQIPYTAAAELSVAVKNIVRERSLQWFDAIVVDVRTPEGSAVVVALESLATEIVRGF